MSKNTIDLAELIVAVWPNIRRVFRHLVSLKDAPISMTQLTCLSIIEKQNKLTMSALAKKLSMSNQQLTKVVDTLEGYELVVRTVDETNHRQIFVQTSERGKQLMYALRAEIDRKLNYVLRNQDEGEIDNLYNCFAYLAKYFAKIDE